MEAEGRARMSWHVRLWRRYRKPSAVVLDQFSELQAERVLDIIEEALGSELANKQQQALKQSFKQQQPPANVSAHAHVRDARVVDPASIHHIAEALGPYAQGTAPFFYCHTRAL